MYLDSEQHTKYQAYADLSLDRSEYEDIGFGGASFDDMEIKSMQERRRERRKTKRERNRQRKHPSGEVVAKIQHINQILTKTQIWIMDAVRDRTEAYLIGGGVIDRDSDYDDHREILDFGFDVQIKFSFSERDPDADSAVEYNNRITLLHRSIQPGNTLEKEFMTDVNWNEGLDRITELAKTSFCYLFHELYDHQLNRVFGHLLRIGEIWVDLVCTRQRIVEWKRNPETEAEPIRTRTATIYSNEYFELSKHPLNLTERKYVDILNIKAINAEKWIMNQIRAIEDEYLTTRGVRHSLIDTNTYEDYVLSVDIDAMLGDWHPEYALEMDNIMCSFREPLCKHVEMVFGRDRNSWRDESFRFSVERDIYGDIGAVLMPKAPGKKRISNLFHVIHEQLGRDWSRTLHIGGLWLNIRFIQRRIIRI